MSNPWRYVDSRHLVVVSSDGLTSHAVGASEIVAYLAANGVIDPAPAADPTQLFTAALSAGCQIVSAGTAALSGTWGISPQDELNLSGLQGGITVGAPWLGFYRDKAGLKHTLTAAQFTTLAEIILAYVEALDEALETALSGTWTAPAQPVNIS